MTLVLILVAIGLLGLNCIWAGVLFWRNKLPSRGYVRTQGTLLILLGVAISASVTFSVFEEQGARQRVSDTRSAILARPGDQLRRLTSPETAEIVKEDCQRLIDGSLLFEPSKTMRQGHWYTVFARLSRNPGVNIAKGLNGRNFVIVSEKVSCEVSLTLDSEEPEAFLIENQPAGRKDIQALEPNDFTEWDWRVTPRKHGTLHLLLWVAPMLYVDGIGGTLKQFKQPPKIITVTPDYWYEITAFVNDHWAVLGTMLTAVFIPLFLWLRKGSIDWFQKRSAKKNGFFHLP